MENTKLIKFLKLFSKQDFIKLGDFVSSPYFNKIKHVVTLYGSIKQFYPRLAGKDFTKNNIFKSIFPEEKYSDARFRVLCSRLLNLAVKFSVFQKYSEDKLAVKIGVLKSLNPAASQKIFNESLSASAKLAEETNPKDEFYYFKLYELTQLKNLSLEHFNLEKNFQAEADYLSVFFIVSLLKIYTTALNSLQSLNMKLDLDLIDKFSFIINHKRFKDNPLVMIYYNLYQLAGNIENEEYFFKHLELTKQFPGILSKEELYESYVLLLNFCVLKIQNGFKEFRVHKFNLYKTILNKKLYHYQNGYLGYEIFNNIVNSALETGNYKWAAEFTEEYKDMLHKNYKDDIVNLSCARINYYLKQYDKALENLSHLAKIENPYYKFAVKDLTIKIFYEMKYYENILSIIDSYKHLLSKNRQINKDIKKRRNDFLNNLNSLLKIKLDSDSKKAGEFKNSIKDTPPFPNKDWIIEKTEELFSI